MEQLGENRDWPRRVFVVAAHADDDTIGCGGTMALLARAGGVVSVAYLTDGSRSHPGSRRYPPEAIRELREREAADALALLGVGSAPEFFRLPDGGLAGLSGERCEAASARLASSLAAFDPDLVLLPWRRDPHADHVACAALARLALARSRLRVPVAEYEVWLRIRGAESDRPRPGEVRTREVVLDAEALARKRAALLAHRSQTSALIDDDPDGFRIDPELLERWLGPSELFHLEFPHAPHRVRTDRKPA